MSLSSILAVPPGPGVLSSLLFVIVFFNLSVVIVMLSCFSVPLYLFLTTLPHHYVYLVVLIFCIRILPGLMSFLVFSFSNLSNNFACFEHTALFLPHTFLVEMMLPLHFASAPQSLLLVLYLLPYIYFLADPWFIRYEVHPFIYSINVSPEIPFVEFILSFIFFLHLGSWGFASFVLKPTFFATAQPAAFNNQLDRVMFSFRI